MKEKLIFICKVCGTYNNITEKHCKKCGKDLNLFADVILQAEEEFCESASAIDAEIFVPKIIADDFDDDEKPESIKPDAIKSSYRFRMAGTLVGDLPKKESDTPLKEIAKPEGKVESIKPDAIKSSYRSRMAGTLVGDLPKKEPDTPLKETAKPLPHEDTVALKVTTDKKIKPSKKGKSVEKTEPAKKGLKKGLIIGLICIIVALIAAGVAWYICTEGDFIGFSGNDDYDSEKAKESAIEVVAIYFDALQDYDSDKARACFLNEEDFVDFYVGVDEIYNFYDYVPRMGTQEAFVQELTDEFCAAYHDYYVITDIYADDKAEDTVIVTVEYECIDPENYEGLYKQEIRTEDLPVQALEDAGFGEYEWVKKEEDLYEDIYDDFLEIYWGEDITRLESAGLFFESVFEMRKTVLLYSNLMNCTCEVKVVCEDGEWLIESIDQ